MGGVRLHLSRGGAGALRIDARAADRALQPVQHAESTNSAADGLRRASELEADLPELLRVLPLLSDSSGARETHAVRQRRQRPYRRSVPRRVYDCFTRT